MRRGWLIAALLLLLVTIGAEHAHHRSGHQYDRWREYRGIIDCVDLDWVIFVFEERVNGDEYDSLTIQIHQKLDKLRELRRGLCRDV
jgi:hypothetical protein